MGRAINTNEIKTFVVFVSIGICDFIYAHELYSSEIDPLENY